MGAGSKYSWEEVLAIARVKLANPVGQLGPVFWEEKAREGQLPPILMERMRKGGDLSKYMNRHQIEMQRAIQEIVVSKKVQGRSHKTNKIYNFINSCYIPAVDLAKMRRDMSEDEAEDAEDAEDDRAVQSPEPTINRLERQISASVLAKTRAKRARLSIGTQDQETAMGTQDQETSPKSVQEEDIEEETQDKEEVIARVMTKRVRGRSYTQNII